MDLATAGAILKLITAGHSAWAAWCSEGIDGKELKALRQALELAGDASSRADRPDGAAQHLGLCLAAFGRAYARFWADARELTGSGPRRWSDKAEKARLDDIQSRLRLADLRPFRPGEQPADDAGLADLMLAPVAGAAYRALWKAFSDPALLGEGEEPPLEATATARREFERLYRLAWWEGLQSPGGRQVQAFLASARRDSAEQIGLQLIADMANWDQRHVFGNVRRTPESMAYGPFIPLGEMYIEPMATDVMADDDDDARPILARLDGWLDSDGGPFVAAARADFGRGKSLTARRLVNRLAQRWLTDAETPSPDLWRPIFVRCADDITGPGQPLASIVQGAIKRHAEDLGLDCGLDHPACTLPPDTDGRRLLVVLDGLDEVLLGPQALDGLFKRLRQWAGLRRRVLVMSRPGALPGREGLHGARLFELQPFDPSRIERWLGAWNALVEREDPITHDLIVERQLDELAATPVLLYMIARTWDEASGDAARTRAWLYETFMLQIARGKHERDADHHKPVHDAALALRDRLIELKRLSPEAEPQHALLWLLARLAWRGRQKAWKHRLVHLFPSGRERVDAEPLTRRDIGQIVRDELDLPRGKADAVEIGVILTMQSDPTLGRDHVHFGHKSFDEFLVARFWADRLLALVRGREREWPKHEKALLGARLVMPDDRSFDFLMEILGAGSSSAASSSGWDRARRATLKQWAEDCFNDCNQQFADPDRRAIQDDQRAVLREAALAIGSRIAWMDELDGVRASGPETMASLMGWFSMTRVEPRLVAPKAELPWLHVRSDLAEGEFPGARLFGAILWGANSMRMNFSGAFLVGATLHQVSGLSASFERADLREARFGDVHLGRVDFRDANARSAFFSNCTFYEGTLARANFSGVTLHRVDLHRTTGLDTADWSGARYTPKTRWPPDFDPEAAGAILLEDDEPIPPDPSPRGG